MPAILRSYRGDLVRVMRAGLATPRTTVVLLLQCCCTLKDSLLSGHAHQLFEKTVTEKFPLSYDGIDHRPQVYEPPAWTMSEL